MSFHSHVLPRCCIGLLLASAIAAQGSLVSPSGAQSVEGNSGNNFPFNSSTVRRYMQIHADLGVTPRVITGMSFRVSEDMTNFTGTHANDVEIYMGHGLPQAQTLPSFTFDANYAGPKTTVLPRAVVVHGPTGQASMPGPNPFTVDFVFSVPFVYQGNAPLIWEVAMFGSVLNGAFGYLDAVISPNNVAPTMAIGSGCTPTGATVPMTHSLVATDVGGTLMLRGVISNGPPNALALMAYGFVNPNLSVPELCAPLYTDAPIVALLGPTTATGGIDINSSTGAFVLPNQGAGLPVFTQGFVFDPLSTASLPFVVSNGRTATIPSTLPAPIHPVTRLWNNVGGTAAPTAVFATGSTIGYGLVTRFHHQ